MAIGSRAIKAGEAFVSMILDDKEFADSIEDWQTKLRKVGRNLRPLGLSLAAIGGAITTPFVMGTRSLVAYGGELVRTASTVGIAATEFSKLSVLAEVAGSDVQALGDTVAQLGERMIQAAEGGGEAARTFDALGITVGELMAADNPADRLLMVAGALNDIEDASLRAGLAQSLFSDSSLRLVTALSQTDGIKQFAEAVAMTQENADAALALNVEWTKAQIALRAVGMELATTLAPVMIEVLKVATDVLIVFRGWVQDNPTLVRAIAITGGVVLALGTALLAIPAAASIASTAMHGFRLAVMAARIEVSAFWSTLLLGIPLAIELATAIANAFQKMRGEDTVNRLQILTVSANVLSTALMGVSEVIDKLGAREFSSKVLGWSDAIYGFWKSLGDGPDEMEMPDIPDPSANLNLTPRVGGTSAIAAAFASQQTLGFTASNRTEQVQDQQLAALLGIRESVDNQTNEIRNNAGVN